MLIWRYRNIVNRIFKIDIFKGDVADVQFTKVKNLRKYGKAPFNIAVVHGGPGVSGEMAPVARELSLDFGILEPLQTQDTIDGQIQELQDTLTSYGDFPITVIGHSWGAWLSYIFASRFGDVIKKLILISSGSFEEKYASGLIETRLKRLNEDERLKFYELVEEIYNSSNSDKNSAFAKLGKLIMRADSYKPVCKSNVKLECNYHIYQSVWSKASMLRQTGELLKIGREIQCPVLAIHGDYDPHLSEGVEKPLSKVLKNFRFVLLKKCGHEPWNEEYVKDEFYKILKSEISN